MATRTVSQSISLQADQTSKYITRISSDGITVHPEVQNSRSNYIHIDSNGLKIKNQASGIPVVGTDTVLASFMAEGAQIGQTGESHIEIDYHSLQLKDKEGNTYFHVSDLRDENDEYKVTETVTPTERTQFTVSFSKIKEVISVSLKSDPTQTFVVDNVEGSRIYLDSSSDVSNKELIVVYVTTSDFVKAFTFGRRKPNSFVGPFSSCIGYECESSGNYSCAEGLQTTASGNYSHAEGYCTTASGNYSHAENIYTTASGNNSHAEGVITTASGNNSHAEGTQTIASGYGSHAEGRDNTASGPYSHAEGYYTQASGQYSHAQNYSTIASKSNQTAIGKYNIEDTTTVVANQKALIIGNGTSSQRSNALTVDWEGNVDVNSTGGYSVGGTNILELVYPVGSIYMSVNSTDPGTLFGGTWTRLTDTFLLAAGSTYAADDGTHTTATGGAASVSYTPAGSATSHALTVEELPAHYHAMRYATASGSLTGGYDWVTTGKATWSSATESSTGMKGAGSGQGHTHGFSGTKATIKTMPPYLTVYVWKRTA